MKSLKASLVFLLSGINFVAYVALADLAFVFASDKLFNRLFGVALVFIGGLTAICLINYAFRILLHEKSEEKT